MTIPSELMDFTHIANATCTECVQRVKPGAPPKVTAPHQDRRHQRFARPSYLAESAYRNGSSDTIKIVDVTTETESQPGQPRSDRDAAFMVRYEARMRLPIIAAAVLPLVVVPGPASRTSPAPSYPVTPRTLARAVSAESVSIRQNPEASPDGDDRYRHSSARTQTTASVGDVDDRDDGPDQRDEDHLAGAHRVGSRHQRRME